MSARKWDEIKAEQYPEVCERACSGGHTCRCIADFSLTLPSLKNTGVDGGGLDPLRPRTRSGKGPGQGVVHLSALAPPPLCFDLLHMFAPIGKHRGSSANPQCSSCRIHAKARVEDGLLDK